MSAHDALALVSKTVARGYVEREEHERFQQALAVLDGEVRSTRPISWALASSASADDGEAPIVTHKSEKRGGTAAGSGTGS